MPGPNFREAADRRRVVGCGEQIDEPSTDQALGLMAVEVGERAIRERECRVGEIPADELGLVVDDRAVVRLALA